MFFVLAAIIVAGLGGYLLYLDARRKRAQVADDSELYDDSARDYGPDPIEPAGDEAEAFANHHDFDVGQGPARETDYGQPVSPKPTARPARPESQRGSAYGPNSGRPNLPNQSNQQPGRSNQSGGQAGQQNQPGQPGQRRPRPAAGTAPRTTDTRTTLNTQGTTPQRPAARNERPRPGTTAPKKARQTTGARPRHPQEPARPPGRHKGRKTNDVTTRTTALTATTWHNHTNGNPAPHPPTPHDH